jgi:uncharacterized membrane protein YeiH
MNAEQFSYMLGMAGTVAFSVTAVLAVTPKGIDLFGACVMGLITSIGGGTIRDVILNIPVFWATDLNYIWVALTSSVVAFYGNQLMTRKEIYQTMLYVDGIGVSLFAIQAAHKVEGLEFAMPLGPILLGVLTAIGGGILRDMLSGSPTLLMKKELYAVPITLGCTLYIILIIQFPGQSVIIGTCCVAITFVMRAAAIYWKLSVPEWMLSHAKNE